MEKSIYKNETECPRCGNKATLRYPQDKDYTCKCGRFGLWDTFGLEERPLDWCWSSSQDDEDDTEK